MLDLTEITVTDFLSNCDELPEPYIWDEEDIDPESLLPVALIDGLAPIPDIYPGRPYYVARSIEAELRDFNTMFPKRTRSSSGWLGNASHAAHASDHNPDYAHGGIIRAGDLTTTSWGVAGLKFTAAQRAWHIALIDDLIATEKANPVDRAWYFIHWIPGDPYPKIWSRTTNWAPKRYTGASPHDHHFHTSIMRTNAAAADTKPWFTKMLKPLPPVPPWKFADVAGISVGPITPDVLWQCGITNDKTGETLVAVASSDVDSLFVRMSADHTHQLDSMTVTGTHAHQTEFGWLADGRVTFTVNDSRGNDQAVLPYRKGRFSARSGKALHVGTDLPTQMTFSPTGAYAVLRVFESGNNETFWRLPATKVLGTAAFTLASSAVGRPVRVVPNAEPTQGFGSSGDQLYILKGHTDTTANPNRRYIERKSFATGKHVATQSLDAVGADDVSVEPEGMDGSDYWLKEGTGINRRLRRHSHNLGSKP